MKVRKSNTQKQVITYLLSLACVFSLHADPTDSIHIELSEIKTTQQTQSTQLELLEKKIDLAKEANENRLNAMQVSIDKQLFYLDPLILAGVGLSAIGGLIYLFVSFVPKRVRDETARKIAALTDADQATVAEVIAQRELAKKMKKTARISILCADDAQKTNAETLLKDLLGFQNVTSDPAADFDLMIFYDPKAEKAKWDVFITALQNAMPKKLYLYFGSANDFERHEHLNFANSKFTLESRITQTLQLHPNFKNA